jgi:hypothetical protein
MDFSEFLEMIGRIAEVLYRDESGMRDRPFEDKLEKVLEQVLASFGYTLKPKVIEVVYVSESENEFDEEKNYL